METSKARRETEKAPSGIRKAVGTVKGNRTIEVPKRERTRRGIERKREMVVNIKSEA